MDPHATPDVSSKPDIHDLSVVVPARNAQGLLEECLASVARANPREIIVVDGMSTDRTVEIAARYNAKILSDEGRGLPLARTIGAQVATGRWVAFIDADVVLTDGALEDLLEEFVDGDYAFLQAGLHSVGGPGYWGRALAHHHREGRSKNWPGVVATILERSTILEVGFDEVFASGEDMELRERLYQHGAHIGVSSSTIVTHRFAEDTFAFARDQWLADGHGLARMVRKHRGRAIGLLMLPAAAAARGILLSLVRLQPQWVPYYLCYLVYNTGAIWKELLSPESPPSADSESPASTDDAALGPEETNSQGASMLPNSLGLIAGTITSMALGGIFWVIAARFVDPSHVGLATGAVSAMLLCTLLAVLGLGPSFISHFPSHRSRPRDLIDAAFTIVAGTSVVGGGIFLLLASRIFSRLSIVAHRPAFAALFLLLIVLSSWTHVLDSISMAIGRSGQVLARNAVSGLLQLTLVVTLAVVAASPTAMQLFSLWVPGAVVLCLLGLAQLRRALGGYRYRPRIQRALAGRLVGLGVVNHALTLADRAPGLILPVLVTELLSPETNAYWYAVWMMALAVNTIPIATGTALLAEASHRPGTLRRAVAHAIRFSLGLGILAACVMAIAAPIALGLLGRDYADNGTAALRVLLPSVIPMTFVQSYFAVCRATARLPEAITTGIVGGAVGIVGAALFGVDRGLTGIAGTWLVAQSLMGVWALGRLPSITRRELGSDGSVLIADTHGDDQGDTATRNRLRVLMTTARYLPEQGGTEIHTSEVSKRLAAAGLDVTVLTTALREPFARTTQEGLVTIVRVRAWPRERDYYLAPEMIKQIRRRKVDLVHCQGYHTFVAPIVMLTALASRIPYVLTLHSGGHSSAVRRSIRPLQAWMLRPLLTRARAIVAVSQFEAQHFAHRLRMPVSDFTVIPSGAELPAPNNHVPSPDAPLVVCLGRVEKYKGHHRVIEALPQLRQARPDLRVRILGSGPFERQVRTLARNLGVDDSVDIAPVAVDRRDEMARVLQRASVVASLSDYESQGLGVQEALALGRPLLVSDNTALTELSSYPNVRTVGSRAGPEEIARAILELLETPAVAPSPIDVPTWDNCAGSVLELYERVLAPPR